VINVVKHIQDLDVSKSIKEPTREKNLLNVKFVTSHSLKMATLRLICVSIPEKSLSAAKLKVVVGLLPHRVI
jgi:hypothetical protein